MTSYDQFLNVNPEFWKGKSVFLTGHTGFKGSWTSLWLQSMGAKVTGYSLKPITNPNLYDVLQLNQCIESSHFDNVCDLKTLQTAMKNAAPDIVIHMAAQALVRYSYENPVETYLTNVMGTVNVLESARAISSIRAILVVTSDKCYENKEWVWGYRENEAMGGFDPYSNSKGCAELVVSAYRDSFFSEKKYDLHGVAIATARAGNVIGGGDWSADRLIPDAIRAFESNQSLIIRNPLATRPWQHVLEPISGYLVLVQHLFEKGTQFNGGWNFGPSDSDTRTVEEVINILIKKWGPNVAWELDSKEQPHEAHALKLDCSKSKQLLRWQSKWSIENAVDHIVHWHQSFPAGADMNKICLEQIKEYQSPRTSIN